MSGSSGRVISAPWLPASGSLLPDALARCGSCPGNSRRYPGNPSARCAGPSSSAAWSAALPWAAGWPVHRGNHRHLHRLHRQGNTLDTLAIALCTLSGIASEIAAAVSHIADVATGTERRPRPGDHQNAYVLAVVDPLCCGDDVINQVGAGEGIAQVVPVQGQHGHPVFQSEQGISKLGQTGHRGVLVL